jgi:putative PIN family toxin of toxin-antitoxin system
MRVVLDTNIVVRAAHRGTGPGRELLLLAMSERHTLVLSHPLYAEIEKVIRYPRVRSLHGLDDADIRKFLDFLITGSELIAAISYHIGPIVGLDPNDDMVLLTATAGAADAIGTNNKHFFMPDAQQFAGNYGVRIMRDRDLLAELRS